MKVTPSCNVPGGSLHWPAIPKRRDCGRFVPCRGVRRIPGDTSRSLQGHASLVSPSARMSNQQGMPHTQVSSFALRPAPVRFCPPAPRAYLRHVAACLVARSIFLPSPRTGRGRGRGPKMDEKLWGVAASRQRQQHGQRHATLWAVGAKRPDRHTRGPYGRIAIKVRSSRAPGARRFDPRHRLHARGVGQHGVVRLVTPPVR